jgi:predicted CopG family antitoxin
MRNKHYTTKNFRLSDEIIKKLAILKEKENTSYNVLIKKLLENYEKPY